MGPDSFRYSESVKLLSCWRNKSMKWRKIYLTGIFTEEQNEGTKKKEKKALNSKNIFEECSARNKKVTSLLYLPGMN